MLALPPFPSVPYCSWWDKLVNNVVPADSTCCGSCGDSCGFIGCVSTSRECTGWSYKCAFGGGSFLPTSDSCNPDSSCNVSNYQLCDNQSCGVWTDKGCGEWNCSPSQMYQDKICVDSIDHSHFCSFYQQCVSSFICETVLPNGRAGRASAFRRRIGILNTIVDTFNSR